MVRKNRMLVFAPDAVNRLMRMKGINDNDLRNAGIAETTMKRIYMDKPFRALPVTYMKLCKVLSCKKGDITYWQGYEMPDAYDKDDDWRQRKCAVCGKTFIPFTTTKRPDGTISVAGKYYRSFQCCEEAIPQFKRKDKRKDLENYRGHGNNFTKKGSDSGSRQSQGEEFCNAKYPHLYSITRSSNEET